MVTFEGFDSILVRLKVENPPISAVLKPKFRFHTGSIKSLYKNRKHIIHDPYGPCQADFYFRVCKVFGSAFLEIRVDVLEKNRYPLEN